MRQACGPLIGVITSGHYKNHLQPLRCIQAGDDTQSAMITLYCDYGGTGRRTWIEMTERTRYMFPIFIGLKG